jgi:uncharacterized surface protein with fasciclin (FAS1) repeats
MGHVECRWLQVDEVLSLIVSAGSLVCFWAARELGMSLPTLESTGQVTMFTAGESETIAAFANVSGGTAQSSAKSCNQLSKIGDNAQRQQK